MQTIKSIETKHFELRLSQSKAGSYYVAYYRKNPEEELSISDAIQDYRTADMAFEAKLQELEGH